MNIALPSFGKPSSRRMEQLLEQNPTKFEQYLAKYPDLADYFEDNNPFQELSNTARRALDAATAVPTDIAQRIRARLDESSTETTPFALILDMTTLGFSTLRELSDPEPLT